jgi:hypothetical protein
VDDVEEAHNGGAVVGDGDAALVVVNELVHAAGPQRGAHRVHHRRARVDVAHHLRLPLRRVRALLEQDNLRLLRNRETKQISVSRRRLRNGGRRARALLPTSIADMAGSFGVAWRCRLWGRRSAAETTRRHGGEGFSTALSGGGRRRRGARVPGVLGGSSVRVGSYGVCLHRGRSFLRSKGRQHLQFCLCYGRAFGQSALMV